MSAAQKNLSGAQVCISVGSSELQDLRLVDSLEGC